MDLRVWQTLAEPRNEELIRLAGETNATDVAAVAKLRKANPDAEVVRAALMLAEARRKAVPKFGAERAARLWADPQGVEMATSAVVADYKNATFNMLLCGKAGFDLCCGIGGDAMALASTLDLTVVDSDPVRAWMAHQNSGCSSLCVDATTIDPTGAAVHIDPARRSEGHRVWHSADLLPPITDVQNIMQRTALGGAIKLGPGADIEAIEAAFPNGMVDVVSERGRLVQMVVWIEGEVLAVPGERQATLVMGEPGAKPQEKLWVSLRSPATVADAPAAEAHRPGRYVFEPDDSVERAGLFTTLCEKVGSPMLHPRVGLLTADGLIASPWLTAFEVLAEMPWNERRVKAALEERGAGIVEVKTRGGVVDTDAVQHALRGSGAELLTVFVLRMGTALRAIIARRVRQPA